MTAGDRPTWCSRSATRSRRSPAAADEAEGLERFGDDVGDAAARAQRAVGVLEDDLRLAAHLPHLAPRQRGEVRALEEDAALARLDQPQEEPAEGGLAAAGFADDRERLAALDREARRRRPRARRSAAPSAKTAAALAEGLAEILGRGASGSVMRGAARR